MSNYHQSPFEDSGGNILFTSFSSNITDVSLISTYWNDIIYKPSFCNISLTSSYNDLINVPSFATVATTGNYNDLTNKPWTYSGNNIYNINSNIGIGTDNPQYKLDVHGNINFTGSLNQNGSEFKTSQWVNSNLSIFYNLGNVGIGKSIDINEKLDIYGNIKVNGNIYSGSNNNNIGTSNNKWMNLYLSGQFIYFNNISIYTNSSSNQLEIKDSNYNYKGIKVNQFELNSNNNNFKIKLNESNDLIYNKNNINYYPVFFDNQNDFSNIVFNSNLILTSNNLIDIIDEINTDTITIGTNNRFIINDIYNRNITFTQTLTASNITTSNLSVIGDSTTINTTVYQTEQLQIVNNTQFTALYVNQINSTYNVIEFYKNNQIAFTINSNGYIGINKTNPEFTVDINGSLNSSEVFIKNINVSNIITNKITDTSNILINYNNLNNKPVLSSVAISGNYNDLTNKTWITATNNIYNANSAYIGIGTNNPLYSLDVNGSLNSGEVFIKNTNVSNIINNKILETSNILINYENLNNKPSLSTVALSGSYNDLLNKPSTMEGTSNYNDLTNKTWINSGNNIYNNNSGFIGIGTNNPLYKLDIIGSLNTNEVLIKNTNISNIIDNKIIETSNILINYNNLTNKPSLTTVATSGSYTDLTNKPILATIATNGDYNDLINKTWINSGNNIYNNNSDFIGIGTNNPLYKLDINGSLNTNTEVYVKNTNVSNIIDSKVLITSNSLNTKINAITTDTITLGTNNRFISNDTYNRNVTFTQNLNSSNIITSNLSVIGDTTTLNTTVYQTEQLQIINDTTATPVIIKQLNSGYNVAEFYNNTQPTFIINSNGNIGINTTNPEYKVDINGNINTTENLIKGTNISNIIDSKITVTSNVIVNYNNLINRPSLATVATSGNYNDLINKSWVFLGNDIYNANSGNTGIGITNPTYKLDINGSLNTNTDIFIKTTNISNIIDSKITIFSNVIVNYNNLINKPSLATVATSGDYNDLINKPSGSIGGGVSDYNDLTNKTWINSGTNIYNSNSLNVGIGKTNPQYKLDVIGDININGSLRLSNSVIPFSSYSNTNIIASNAMFSYSNSSYGYYTFLTNGTITFPQNTNCDILIVGAGGNGGTSNYAGGGGAGEIIYYPNYPFTTGTSNIIVGYSSFNSNNRISKITYNNNDIVKAIGGGNGSDYTLNNISYTGSGNTINTIDSSYNYIYFVNSGTLILNTAVQCDIFMIGGGGAGGWNCGGGGGAGAAIIAINQTISVGTYNITVGAGGTVVNGSGNNGGDTSIGSLFVAKGGGGGGLGAGGPSLAGSTGGCSGGCGGVFNNPANGLSAVNPVTTNIINGATNIGPSITSSYAVLGNKGGNSTIWNTNDYNTLNGSGGGGIGVVGGNATASACGVGGDGIYQITIGGTTYNLKNYFSPNSSFGVNDGSGNYYIGGGAGGGGFHTTNLVVSGGKGGGANGKDAGSGISDSGIANTGGGGGGGTANTNTAGAGGSGILIIRYSKLINNPIIGGSGGGGVQNQTGALSGTKWNATYSYVNNGSNGSALQGGNGGSSFNGGFIELITGSNLIVGSGGTGATSTSIPVIKTTYGSGGDGNGGMGTQGIIIIKVPLNTTNTRFDGYINYSNINNRPYINDLYNSKNFIDIGYYNQVNFPQANISLANEWFVYKGTAPTNTSNSLIFWHVNSNVNSKWWFNGTTANTNNEISDGRVKKEITDIINPLDKIMLLQPKEYMLCDEKDYLKKYGIIAQDVKEVLPDFVYIDEDYIANIYSKAIYNDDNNCYTLRTTIDISNLISINDELKILLDNNNTKQTEIIIEDLPYHNRYKKRFVVVKSIIDTNTIELKEPIEAIEIEKLNIFIYGKKVKDFLKLDYSSLYTLNISSIQTLYKLILKQELLINNLEKKINI